MLVTTIKPIHIPMLVYIKFLDFSHWPGEANVIGMLTTKIVDNITRVKTSNWMIIVII